MGLFRWLRLGGADAAAADAAGYRPLGDDGRWCPEEGANPISRLLFSYTDSLMRKGKQKTLEPSDLWDMSKKDVSTEVYDHFAAKLESTRTEEAPNGRLGPALFRSFWKPFLASGILKLFHDCLMFLGPFLLRRLLRSLQESEAWTTTLVLAVLMTLASICQTLFVNQYFLLLFRIGLHVKVATIHLVYDKLLRLSNAEKADMGNGTITNLQSNDTSKLWQIPQYLHMLWSGPFQIIVVMAMLINVMKLWPALAGFLVTVALIPLNTLLGKAVTAVRKKVIAATDARVRMATEVIMGIKAIKLYAWEEPYLNRIAKLREEELKAIRTSNLLGSFYMMIFIAGPVLVSLASFTVYALMGNSLTSDVAFPALALFNLLRFPIMMFPIQIMNMLNGAVALKRLQAFLGRDETDSLPTLPPASQGQPAITVSNGTFAWSKKADAKPALDDLNIKVMAGELIMVVGEVGSGKSSLLQALLGEMVQQKGDVNVKGEIAYTSQDSWIQNDTLKGNIIMGRPLDPAYYEYTLDVCALRNHCSSGFPPTDDHNGDEDAITSADLRQLTAGDQTEIGEKGINLSGGQRARVALARAVYARADVYLMDDPLSAVDAHVGAHLFQECMNGALQKTTRVLVTHQLQFLSLASKIAVMSGGKITAFGTFEDLRGRVNFQAFTIAPPEDSGSEIPVDAPSDAPVERAESRLPESQGAVNADDSDADAEVSPQERSAEAGGRAPPADGQETASQNAQPKADRSGRLVMDEMRAKGQVKKSVYLAYMSSWGAYFVLPVLFVSLLHLERVSQVLQNLWLSVWSNATAADPHINSSNYLMVYFGLGVLSLVFAFTRTIALVYGAFNASRQLHRRLLATILRMPMSFFDTQPTGRLLNRFTKDTEAVDIQIASSFSSFALCFVNVWMSLAVVMVVTPVFTLMVFPIGWIYWGLQDVFIATSRELKRLDSVAFSPIFSQFSETLNGITTVRAFRRQDLFSKRHQNLLDGSNKCWWPIQVANRWLSVRLELIGTAISFVTAICVAVLLPTNSGLAGLALTSALNLTGLMTWMVRQTTDLEVNMNSVERMIEYEGLPSEAPAEIEDAKPPSNWPSRGEIRVNQLVVKYREDLDPVLKGLTFGVRGAEKIGIAGRTGCGKSTLMMTIFRIVEPCGGSMFIDGINVLEIGLHDLRSRLALVPQDPVIFSGTVRSNLDPFDEHSDQQLWSALSKVSMDGVVRNMKDGLFSAIEEGGQNLSVGQRQLLGMARALIRNARILVLDEATSNVDTSTDLLIQTTIRGAFAECTVLTIAHRLHTIMRSDRIMVLDAGEIGEFDSPANLLLNTEGMFSKLVEEASRHQTGMKVTASQEDIARIVAEEADKVRRLSLERQASVDE